MSGASTFPTCSTSLWHSCSTLAAKSMQKLLHVISPLCNTCTLSLHVHAVHYAGACYALRTCAMLCTTQVHAMHYARALCYALRMHTTHVHAMHYAGAGSHAKLSGPFPLHLSNDTRHLRPWVCLCRRLSPDNCTRYSAHNSDAIVRGDLI